MADDLDIQYSLDPSGYLVGVNQIDQANQRLQQSMTGVVTTTSGLQRAWNVVTPSRAALAGLALFAQQAGQTEQQLSGLSATSSVTGVNVTKLGSSIRQTAREMPVGFQTARQLTEQYTRMGVAGAGSEKQIDSLVKVSAKLSGATGEGPAQLAQGMVELSRATGNSNLDPKRFEALSDSLTTVTAKMGASATGTLAFSKSIAPMAQNAGIGATSVLGISAAFSRLGEDGIGATTAVTKMLSDMNRAVREGGPQMKTYAQIAGMTAGEFERLYKANPAEALTQVTESIAKAGTGGPRMLEQLGLDGVRSMRSLQALSASGGLRPAIAEATAAYGTGSTDKAAQAAFGGLNDSITELRTSSQQLAEAFGQPLLAPLTAFTDALKVPTNLLTKAVSSGPGQGLITTALAGTGLVMGAKAIAGPLGVLAGGRQMATSGPMRSIAAGLASGLGMDPASRTARYGAQMEEMLQNGTLGDGFIGPFRERAYGFAEGVGEKFRQRYPKAPPGPGIFERVKGNVNAYGQNIAQSYLGMIEQQMRNATIPAGERESTFGMSEGFVRAGQTARDTIVQGGLKDSAQALRDFHREVKASTGATATFRGTMQAAFGAMQANHGFVKQMGDDIKTGAKKAASGLGDLITPEMLMGGVASGAIGVLGYGMNRAGNQAEERAAWGQGDIASSINAYRESIGKATDTTTTYTSLAENLTRNLSKTASTRDFDSVKQVTDDDMAAAAGSRDKVTQKYSGSPKDIAAQIAAQAPGGIAPDELQAIKVDLARQMGRDQVQQVLNALPGSINAEKGGLTSKDLRSTVSQISGAASTGRSDDLNKLLTVGAGTTLNDVDMASMRPGWMRGVSTAPGGGLYRSSLTDTGRSQIESMTQGIAQDAKNNTKYGANYVLQEQAKQMNESLKAAYEAGNGDVFMELSTKYGQMLGGSDYKDKIWKPSDFKKSGFDFTKMVADESDAFRSTRDDAMKAGMATAGDGGIKRQLQLQPYVSDISRDSYFLGQVFDPRATSNPASRAMQASLNTPENVGLQADALDAVIEGATKAGKSMQDLALESARAAQKVSEGSSEWLRLRQIQQRAEQGMTREQQGMTTGQSQMAQYEYFSKLATMRPTTESERQQQEEAKGQVIQLQDAMRQRMVQRLQLQRSTDIQRGRMTEDFNTSQQYAREDYGTSVERTNRNFNIQTERAERQYRVSTERAEQDFYRNRERAYRDFAISMERAQEDFDTGRERQLRDFHISAQRAEEDYQTSRARQIRDFNKQIARQIEDAAAQMYDPYSRIQTKATYDAQNLMMNMAEQTEAMQKQKQQLDQLRQLGLSASAIDILGLGKAENAQQLNNLVADAGTDPKVIAQLNAQAKARSAAAGALTTDPSNKELTRAREDLNRSMKDSESDFRKSVKRSKEDLARTMGDQLRDYNKNLRRSRADLQKGLRDSESDFRRSLARNAEDYSYNLTQSKRDLHNTLTDMEKDFGKSISRQQHAFDLSMTRMTDDVAEADKQIAGSFEDLSEATNKAIHGQAVNWQKILKDDTKSWVSDMKTNVVPQLDAIFKGYGVDFKNSGTTSGGVAKSSGGGSSTHGGSTKYAEGGEIAGSSPHPKADNIPIWATAGEFMHPVDAVNYYGVDTLEAMRQKKIPKELFAGFADGGLIEFGKMLQKKGYAVSEHPLFGGVHPVHTVGSQHYNKQGPGGGGAIDVNADPFNSPFKNEAAAINQIIGLAGQYGLRTIWQSAGHYDHAHFDISKNADMVGKAVASLVGPRAAGGGVGGATLDSVFAGLDQGRGGVYGQLTKAFMEGFAKSDVGKMLASGGGGGIPGDTGAHTSNARANQAIARRLLGQFGWGMDQMDPLIKLWNGESGWNQFADNPSSDAYGIPQALPGSKMSSSGSDWRTNPETQIKWGLGYIKNRPDYGSPAKAWEMWNSRSPHWYDKGGKLRPGSTLVQNDTNKVEAVLTDEQWRDISSLAAKGAVSLDDSRMLQSANGAHVTVNNNQSYSYDQRNDFSGAHITIQSNDPDDMGRQLEARAARGRLTQTRGVRRSP